MLLYLIARIISSISAFIYPGYASFKTLSQRPASEEDLERWLMYWSVLGCVVGVEYVAEWMVSWIPLYHTIKTLFLLYLALPQTAGSTYIYRTHLAPFLHAHETQIDAAMASLRARALAFLQEKLRALWDAAATGMQNQPPTAAQPPTLQDPVSGPAQMLGSLWGAFGPSVIASGAALLRQAQSQPAAAARAEDEQAFHSPPAGPSRVVSSSSSTTQSVLERRRQLETELAALGEGAVEGYDVGSPLLDERGVAATGRTRTSSSESDLRDRGTAGRGFEEVEVPSDAEGPPQDRQRPQAKRTSGWFGGWGAPSHEGYERVKSD